MFFPDGLLPLVAVLRACQALASDRFPDVIEEGNRWPTTDRRAELYAEMLLDRFLDANENDLWAFAPPSTLVRVFPALLYRWNVYHGACPTDMAEAESALEHLRKGPRFGISHDFRIDSTPPIDFSPLTPSPQYFLDLAPLHRAVICWKVESWPVDAEKEIRPFLDHNYWRGVPQVANLPSAESDDAEGLSEVYQAFLKFCPDGKEASQLTWQEIQKKTGWSRRHITRAIRACGGQASGHVEGKTPE